MHRPKAVKIVPRRLAVLAVGLCMLAGAQPQEMPRAVPALNWLDQDGEYFHSPVLATLFQGRRVRLRAPEFIVEFGGLLVPAGFDCDVFNENDANFEHPLFPPDELYPYARWAGAFPSYFMSVPSRWISCWQQHAAAESGLRYIDEQLPAIDEEYPQYVSWAHSALRARDKFVGVELGARWGTWGARGVTVLRRDAEIRQRDALPYSLLYVEPNSEHCTGLEQVHKLNGIQNFTLICDLARAEDIAAWVSQHSRVDIVDMDIESAEAALLLDAAEHNKQLRRLLRERAARLVIGTHSAAIHANIRAALLDEGWRLLSETPFTECGFDPGASHGGIINRFLRPRGHKKSPEALLDSGCYHEHPLFGPLAQYDGSLIFDNPGLVSDLDLALGFDLDSVFGPTVTDDLT